MSLLHGSHINKSRVGIRNKFSLNINGHLKRYQRNSLTDVLTQQGVEYFTEQKEKDPNVPVFMTLSFTAPKFVFNRAPQYEGLFKDAKVPHLPNYNYSSPDKHWSYRVTPPLTQESGSYTDVLYRERL